MKKLIPIIICFTLILSSCQEQRTTRQGFYFDTAVNITVEKKDEKLLGKAMDMCRKYENIFSRTSPASRLYKLNNNEPFARSRHLDKVIDFSLEMCKKTNGAFDITVAPLCDLWDINNRKKPPSDKEIEAALQNVGYEELGKEKRQIDLGAVAKGYIADALTQYLKENNADNAIIDLGGNVAIVGEATVGIRNPFNPDTLFAAITVKDKSAVTSGAYQRYFTYKGVRYHHILDPRTGKCAESGVASVTVVSDSSLYADALSTAIFVLGKEGLSLCGDYPNTDAIIIMNDKSVVTTRGFKEKYNYTQYK